MGQKVKRISGSEKLQHQGPHRRIAEGQRHHDWRKGEGQRQWRWGAQDAGNHKAQHDGREIEEHLGWVMLNEPEEFLHALDLLPAPQQSSS